MARNEASMDGLLIPGPCLYTTLESVGAGATDSTYTEATPRPGLPTYQDSRGRLEVEVSGAQSEGMMTLVRKSGQPARDGIQLIWKQTDEASAAYRSWETPGLQTGFVPLGTDDWGSHDSSTSGICLIPSTGKIVAACYDTNTTEIVVTTVSPDESVSVVQTGFAMDVDWGDGLALCVLPDERVLMFVGRKAYYSDDSGATWALYSESITSETVTTYGRTTVVQYRGDLLMLVEDDTTAYTIYHLASTDGGASFGLVDTLAGVGRYIDGCANEDGIHLTWTLGSSTSSRYRKLGSVFEELDAVAATVISNAGSSSCIASDAAGILYIPYHSTTTAGRIFFVHSIDGGVTWVAHDGGWNLDSVAVERIWMRAVWQTGRLAMLHGVTGTDMCGIGFSGGWSTAVANVADPASYEMARRVGWCARTGTSNADGGHYEPFIAPVSMGWTGSGGAATVAVHASGSAQFVSAANELSYSQAPGTMTGSVLARIRLLIVSGGSLTSQIVGFAVRVANGTYDYEIALQMLTTGFRILDVNGAATLADVTQTMTAYTDIMVWLDNTGAAKVCHRSPGATTWTTDYNGSAVTNDAGTPNANGIIRWGHIATGTATSRWREVAWCVGTSTERPRLALPLDYTNGWGKPLNARPESLPDFAVSSKVARIAVTAGPGRYGDIATIPPYYEHGIHHTHAEVSPSPRSKWRSTSTAEQSTVYDLGDTGHVGHGVALYVSGANFRTIYLENYVGAAWVTRGTLDLATGFTGLTPVLDGDTIYPNTATTAAGGRWLWEGELRDGWVKGTAGSTLANRIVHNSSGTWSTAGTVIPILRMEDGSDLAGVTGCALVWPSGLVVWYPTTMAMASARYWRWRIPAGTAGTDTPTGESYYEAGVVMLGRLQPFGAAWSWGKSTEKEPNVERRTSASGTTRARQRGPAAKKWTAGWSDQQNLMGIRSSATAPTHVGPATGMGMAAHEDVAYLLEGLLDLTEGGARPVVAIEALPATSGTVVTDPQRFLYGHLTSSIRTTRDVGKVLGEDEVIRTDSITVEGIP